MSRATMAQINLAALTHNYRCLQKPHCETIAVVKADAYGHGMLTVAKHLSGLGVSAFAVAFVDEAQTLREAGLGEPILVLEGPMSKDELTWMFEHDCWPMLHAMYQLDWLAALPHNTAQEGLIWVKIDTGMHRLGIAPGSFKQYLKQSTSKALTNNLVLATHFACADTPEHPANAVQREVFTDLIEDCKPVATSVANSATHLNSEAPTHAQSRQFVRLGIALYGCAPNNHAGDVASLQLQPVMRLSAPIIALRNIAAGEGVGYGLTWVAARATTIATVPIGYADGIPRGAGNCASVLVNGTLCPIVGRVSMDMITLDVTDGACEIGDSVVLWGPELPVEHFAQSIDTINYECVTRVSARVPRKVVN